MHKYKIEDRRRRVASLLAQSMTETEIAISTKYGYDRSGFVNAFQTNGQVSTCLLFDLFFNHQANTARATILSQG